VLGLKHTHDGNKHFDGNIDSYQDV
jgi:hypothetical protein